MTANHEHTPTMDRIRDDFIEAWSGHFMDGALGAAEYFDQALDNHNARNKAETLREARQAWFEHTDHMNDAPSKYYPALWLKNRADQMEGDGGRN